MSRTRIPLALVLILAVGAIAVVPLTAAIKALNLEELMSISSGVVYGEIVKKDVLRFDWADMQNVTHTKLTIEGEELTTGQKVTRELYYMGGSVEGQLDSPCTAPKEHQTRVGAKVVAFYWFDETLISGGANKIFCFANLNQVLKGSGDPTVIGLGEGAAISHNIKLSSLRTEVQRIHQKLQKDSQNR